MGISLIGNSPCKIASEILCLSESSSSQQPAKAAGPPASPGAASAAYCQPDLVVKMVKPPQCLPLRKLSCFPAAFPCCQPGPKAPSCRHSPERCGVLSKPGRRCSLATGWSCSERHNGAWVWLSYISDRMRCQGVLCLGETHEVVEGAAQSDERVGSVILLRPASSGAPKTQAKQHEPANGLAVLLQEQGC